MMFGCILPEPSVILQDYAGLQVHQEQLENVSEAGSSKASSLHQRTIQFLTHPKEANLLEPIQRSPQTGRVSASAFPQERASQIATCQGEGVQFFTHPREHGLSIEFPRNQKRWMWFAHLNACCTKLRVIAVLRWNMGSR